MKTNNLITAGKIIALLILVLGLIHDIATFTPIIQGGLSCLTSSHLKAIIYINLVCGTSIMLSGLLIYLHLLKIREHPVLILSTLIIGIFLALTGVFSVIYMFGNPFAWTALILNVLMFVVILIIRKQIKSRD